MHQSHNFIVKFEKRIIKTIKDYGLIVPNDKLLVALSGGKDSMSLLYILHKYFSKSNKIEAIHINLKIGKFSDENLKNSIIFCKEKGIKLNLVTFDEEFGHSVCYIRSLLKSKGVKLKSCSICGVLKKYVLNKKSRILGFSKIAIGHNQDDEVHSFIMNIFRGNLELSARLGPKTGLVEDSRFISRIKPLYFSSNSDIKKYSVLMEFPIYSAPCSCSIDAYRRSIRENLPLTEKEKINVQNYFLSLSPLLKKYYATDKKINSCSICDEPARGNICSTCTLLLKLKE